VRKSYEELDEMSSSSSEEEEEEEVRRCDLSVLFLEFCWSLFPFLEFISEFVSGVRVGLFLVRRHIATDYSAFPIQMDRFHPK
jgi:hypothetical protein